MNKIITVIGFLFSFTSCFCQDQFITLKNPIDFNNKLQGNTLQVSSIESSFTQEKKLSMMTKKLISKGHF